MPRTGIVVVLLLTGVVATAVLLSKGDPGNELPPEIENALQLRNLPANRWVKYHEERPGDWSRQAHAGMAFDSRRGSLLIFGSDTHGDDWDNAVHEFQPRLKRWETHYAAAGPEGYRIDEAGRPVAVKDGLFPWAMHTYDAIEYHLGLDALVVTSTIEHNPRAELVAGIKQQPTWIYRLSDRRWTAFPNDGEAPPTFFGGSSAYDEKRNTLIAYHDVIWELDTTAGKWRRTAKGHHHLHHTMVFASARNTAYVFGDYRPTNTVWAYRPGTIPGEAGSWEMYQPGGDPCPPYTTIPVAYDAAKDVFVLVVDNVEPGTHPPRKLSSAGTYLYDPAANTYTRLPGADMPQVGMNYMMIWDEIHEVIFLVTGGPDRAVVVWAMRPQKQSGN